jgi:hypothetical protein
MTVRGMSMSCWLRSWSERSLSRERAMGTELLTIGIPMIENCRTTASPYSVIDAPMRGRTTSIRSSRRRAVLW